MSLAYEKVTAVFITYNRSDILQMTFDALKRWNGFPHVRKICSDDCSRPEHQARIKAMGFDEVLIPAKNQGLGANTNKGLRRVETDYVLMLQDDCTPVDVTAIDRALEILETDPSVGMVRMMGDPRHFPFTRKQAPSGQLYWVCEHRSPEYAALKTQPRRIRIYSDQAQLRRKSIHESLIGYYLEKVPMENVEMDYEDRIDAQDRFYVAMLSPTEDKFFLHSGTEASLRLGKFRYRLEAKILKVVHAVGMKNWPGYAAGRAGYRALQEMLIKAGILK